MKKIILTESGSTYELDNGFVLRNGELLLKAWWLFCFEDYPNMPISEVPHPFEDEDVDRRLPIQVGKRMYIGNKDAWQISTRIISIEETE